MKKHKQTRAYSLGGVILVILLVVVIVLIVCGCVSFNFESCKDTRIASLLRATDSDPPKEYSDVLADLKKDSGFDAENYPVIAGDNSLKLVQIAESTDGELNVYVYNPSADRTATEIRFSTGIADNAKYVDYALTLRSSSEALSKYTVDGFTVKADALRYYDVVQLSRAWDENIDPKPDGDNTTATVAYSVGQLWTACTVDGKVSYTVLEQEIITVTDKRVGQIYYSNGFMSGSTCYRHYVAFSVDKPMEKLMQADLTFLAVDYTDRHFTDSSVVSRLEASDPRTESITLEADSKGGNSGGYLYTWKRIQSSKEFLEDKELPEITESAKNEVRSMHWVLSFVETNVDVKTHGIMGYYDLKGTDISDVTVLRLMFETDGTVYDLGVVDNKQTGSDDPDNAGRKKPWWERLLRFLLTLPFVVFDWVVAHWKTLLIVLTVLLGLFLLSFLIRLLTLLFGK